MSNDIVDDVIFTCNEIDTDDIFNTIKIVVQNYLIDETSIEDISNTNIIDMYEFVLGINNKLQELNRSLNLNTQELTSFAELGESAQLYTGNLGITVHYSLHERLEKDVAFITEQMTFCYLVLRKIVDKIELNERLH